MWESIYKVSKRERVTKSALYYQCHMVPPPTYYRKITIPGKKDKYMIETDDSLWRAWLEDYKVKKGFHKLDNEQLQKLVKATVCVIKDVYAPSEERLDELLVKINMKFQSYE